MSDITALRAHLFATLAGLKDGSMKPDQAKAINDTAQTIVNTAKVEVDFMRASSKISGSGFFPIASSPAVPSIPRIPDTAGEQVTATGIKHVEPVRGGSVTSHRIR